MPLIVEYNWVTNIMAFIIGLVFFRNFSKTIKIIFLFVLLGILTEISTRIYLSFGNRTTMPIGHFYIAVSFFLVSLFYLNELSTFINKYLVIAIIVFFEMFCLIDTFFIGNLFDFPNLKGSIGAIILMGFSILLYVRIMIEAKIEKLFNEPVVWFNTGILLFYSANLFFYALYNYSLNHNIEFVRFTVIIFSTFNLALYIFIGIGFIKTKK